MNTRRILFVCLGNICRSPLVEVVARHHLAKAGLEVEVASCGTGAWHVGQGADPRMVNAAQAAGYDLSLHRARQLAVSDLDDFDVLFAMDRNNLGAIHALDVPKKMPLTTLFLPWSSIAAPMEFPDPYYGSHADFASAVALAEQGVAGMIERLRTR